MGKSVPTPQYYQPEAEVADAKAIEAPAKVEAEAEDVTENDVKKSQQQSLYFAEQQATADEDSKEKKSFYTSGTSKTLGTKE